MKVKKLQQGGEAAPQAAPQQGGSPEQQIMQMAQEIIGQLGPEAALMLAEAITQMAQQAQTPPTYQRKGGKLVLKGKKA